MAKVLKAPKLEVGYCPTRDASSDGKTNGGSQFEVEGCIDRDVAGVNEVIGV